MHAEDLGLKSLTKPGFVIFGSWDLFSSCFLLVKGDRLVVCALNLEVSNMALQLFWFSLSHDGKLAWQKEKIIELCPELRGSTMTLLFVSLVQAWYGKMKAELCPEHVTPLYRSAAPFR